MQVRKRNGGLEPVDLNKIVQAVSSLRRQPRRQRLDGVDPMRVATRTICGLHDGATTEELDELSIRTAASLIAEEPNYSQLAARLLATFIDKEVQTPGHPLASPSPSPPGTALGIIGDGTAAHGRRQRPQAQRRRSCATATGCFEFFGLRTVYDRYLLRHPETRQVIETPQYFFCASPAGWRPTPEEAIEFYRLISRSTTCPARRRCSTPARPTRRCRAATCSTRRRTSSTPSTTATATSPSCPSSPAASALATPASAVARLADPRHQRPVQRHRAVAEDARLLGRRGQPGRQAQGRGLRLPRDVARRHRGVPRAARQHRRRRPAHAQPQPRQLGPRPVHGAGREGLAVVAVRPEDRSRTSPTSTATSSSRPTSRPRQTASTSARSRRASSTAG